ncbi:hypothetical protein B0H14DRAFT_2581690 [Mycena olivaceomarginata]|nr:hypothetical protein B0H14DRAFT_2581690 [Mycena olivaceomarginata]
MARQNKLTTIPADIHQLLSILPNFRELKIVIPTHRCFHDAFKARKKDIAPRCCQKFAWHEATYGRGAPPTEDFSTEIVSLLVTNEHVLRSLERVGVRLLKRDKDIEDVGAIAPGQHLPGRVQSIHGRRLQILAVFSAAAKELTVFLKNLTRSQLLELDHFVTGLRDLVDAMGGHPPEWEHDGAAQHLRRPLMLLSQSSTEDNEKTHKLLKKAAKERKKASAKKKEQIFHS